MVDRMNNPIVTQVVVFGGMGFRRISDEKLIAYLEREVGKIKRYRRKRIWMPIEDEHVSFNIKRGAVKVTDTELLSKRSLAHVHFESAEVRCRALRESEAERLRIDNCILEISPDIKTIADFERKEFPLTLDVAAVEIGSLNKQGDFNLVWRESNNPSINFVIDPHLGNLYIRFIKDGVISANFKEGKRKVIIKCEVKVECSMGQVSEAQVRPASSSSLPRLMFEFHLTKPAALHYRTAEDEIWSIPGADCLDDSDPWMSAGSKDFKSSGVVRRCLCYRILISPRYDSKLDWFLSYHAVED